MMASEIEPLLTIEEAAAIFRVTEGTIRKFLDTGILRKHKYGGSIRIAKTDVLELMEKRNAPYPTQPKKKKKKS